MIKNFTPHPVAIQRGVETRTFPSEGIARVEQTLTLTGEVEGCPTFSTTYGVVEGLPEPEPGTFYIVSGLVKSALATRTDLLQPADFIRDEQGRIIAARGFIK